VGSGDRWMSCGERAVVRGIGVGIWVGDQGGSRTGSGGGVSGSGRCLSGGLEIGIGTHRCDGHGTRKRIGGGGIGCVGVLEVSRLGRGRRGRGL